jgi:hypothetical protein
LVVGSPTVVTTATSVRTRVASMAIVLLRQSHVRTAASLVWVVRPAMRRATATTTTCAPMTAVVRVVSTPPATVPTVAIPPTAVASCATRPVTATTATHVPPMVVQTGRVRLFCAPIAPMVAMSVPGLATNAMTMPIAQMTACFATVVRSAVGVRVWLLATPVGSHAVSGSTSVFQTAAIVAPTSIVEVVPAAWVAFANSSKNAVVAISAANTASLTDLLTHDAALLGA